MLVKTTQKVDQLQAGTKPTSQPPEQWIDRLQPPLDYAGYPNDLPWPKKKQERKDQAHEVRYDLKQTENVLSNNDSFRFPSRESLQHKSRVFGFGVATAIIGLGVLANSGIWLKFGLPWHDKSLMVGSLLWAGGFASLWADICNARHISPEAFRRNGGIFSNLLATFTSGAQNPALRSYDRDWFEAEDNFPGPANAETRKKLQGNARARLTEVRDKLRGRAKILTESLKN